jgi:hypothetical protein
MKTKVLLMMAICSLIVYSCSTERDEEIKENPTEVKKLELEKLKINNPPGTENRTESDTTFTAPILSPMNSPADPDLGTDPIPNPDPNEGDDPKNVPPRK